MNKRLSIPKRILGTAALPVCMYLVMLLITNLTGASYFGSLDIWKPLSVNIAIAATTALAIGLQFRSGRFDFSGGAIMLLTAIVAGHLAQSMSSNPVVFLVLCIAICLALSIGVSLMYIYGRNPIVIATIGMALLFESITCVIYDGGGVSLVANVQLKAFSTFPVALIPLALALLIYTYYSNFTVSGKQSVLLSHNQQAAANIGINERKNVLVAYCFSGIIFGLATVMFASTALHRGAFSSLSTVGQLFSNILPVFIGLMIGRYSGDTLGTLMGAVTLSIMATGLNAIFDAEMGAAISTICTGVFIFAINVVSGQSRALGAGLRKIFGKKNNAVTGVN